MPLAYRGDYGLPECPILGTMVRRSFDQLLNGEKAMRPNISLLLIAALTTLAPSALAESGDPPSFIVHGQGTVSVPSDMATIRTGVVTQKETAAEAIEVNNTAMQKVLEVLKSHGIADTDVQTVSFEVEPVYPDRSTPKSKRSREQMQQAAPQQDDLFGGGPPALPKSQEEPSEPKIIAYRVENHVQVRVKKLDSLGVVLDALVKAGSNKFASITFGVNHRDELMREARSNAVKDARARAEVYAEAAGVELAGVLEIVDQSTASMHYSRDDDIFGAPSSFPLSGGNQQVTAKVQVKYQIKPAP